MGLFVYCNGRYLVSADTGWSLQLFFPDYNFIVSTSKGGSMPTAWRPLAIHPMVRASRALMWLGRFRKDQKGLSILYIKTNNSTTHGREILVNQISISRLFIQNCLYVCPLQHRGEIGSRSQRFLLSIRAQK